MATFKVWKFPTADGAESALDTLERLQSEELIQVQDAAVVTWEDGKKKPRTRHLNDLTGAGALGGAFWGFLFGLIFFVRCSAWPSARRPGRSRAPSPTWASTRTSSRRCARRSRPARRRSS